MNRILGRKLTPAEHVLFFGGWAVAVLVFLGWGEVMAVWRGALTAAGEALIDAGEALIRAGADDSGGRGGTIL